MTTGPKWPRGHETAGPNVQSVQNSMLRELKSHLSGILCVRSFKLFVFRRVLRKSLRQGGIYILISSLPRGGNKAGIKNRKLACGKPAINQPKSATASPRAAALSSLTQGTPPSPRAGTSTMPNGKLELDEAVITPVVAELRDDANPTDYLVLGE